MLSQYTVIGNNVNISQFLNIGSNGATPAVIGDNVWIGGNVVICPGVHIGSNVVIGAGSVVTKDIPDWMFAAGNPCKVIREITEADRRKYYKNQEIDDEAWEIIVAKEK